MPPLARWIAVAAVLVFLAQASLSWSWVIDDAGISLAYSRTLAAGEGLRAQPGAPPVEGFSNPLWMLAFAALGVGPALVAGIRWWAGFGTDAIEGWPAMLSPVTLVFAVTRDVQWAGPVAKTPTAAWIVAVVMLLAAAAAWTLAGTMARGGRRETSLH